MMDKCFVAVLSRIYCNNDYCFCFVLWDVPLCLFSSLECRNYESVLSLSFSLLLSLCEPCFFSLFCPLCLSLGLLSAVTTRCG